MGQAARRAVVRVLALLVLVAGCGDGSDAFDSVHDGGGAPALGGDDAGSLTRAGDGGVVGARPGRTADEFVIDGARYHALGQDLTVRLQLPDTSGEAAVPACVVLHGSGGLFREGTLGEPCSTEVEPNFAAIARVLTGAGVAALLPSSFFSRDPRFCEDDTDFIQYAPPGYDREARRTALRQYDLWASLAFLCEQPAIDCSRLCLVGASNGGSTVVHAMHDQLAASFEGFFEREAGALDPITYHPVPDTLPRFAFGLAISPGCGLNGAIPLEHDASDLPDAPVAELYYPSAPLTLEVGDQDMVPDHCTYEVPGFEGTRQYQVDEVARRMGVDAREVFVVEVHEGGRHDLVGDGVTGPRVLERLSSLVREHLR